MKDIDDMAQAFFGNTDRSLVILAAAQVDEILKSILTLRLLKSPKSEDALLGPTKPLDTLSSRTHAAYRIGCISKDLFRALEILRSLRNEFAHSTDSQALSDTRLAAKVLTLRKICGSNDFIDSSSTKLVSKGMEKNTATFFCCYCYGIHVALKFSEGNVTRVEEATSQLTLS